MHIGRISREFIYDSNKFYHHVIAKSVFNTKALQMNKNLYEKIENLIATTYEHMNTN
jgi:hypothetical protein